MPTDALTLVPLATAFRAGQLFAHNCHQRCKGYTFFADHPKLGEFYSTYTETYDKLVEHIFGLGVIPDVVKIPMKAALILEELPPVATFEVAFKQLLTMEQGLCKLIDDLLAQDFSAATENLLQGFASESIDRQFQLRGRIAE